MMPDIEQYVKLERIGRGSFGQVFKCREQASQRIVAAKIIDLDAEYDVDVDGIRREVHLLSQCKSHYIVHYEQSLVKGSKLWIIMEYCAGGSLRQLLEVMGPQSEQRVLGIARMLLEALAHLHDEQNVVHRDIKCANIFLIDRGHLRLGDFGVALQDLSVTGTSSNMLVGSPYWMAPEIIRKTTRNFKPADIWSLGITLMELMLGNPPLAHLPPTKVMAMIPQTMPPRLDPAKYPMLSGVVNACLHDDPAVRPTAKSLLKHKSFRYVCDLDGMMRDLWTEYTVRLQTMEPDKQSLLSRCQPGGSIADWVFYEDHPLVDPIPLTQPIQNLKETSMIEGDADVGEEALANVQVGARGLSLDCSDMSTASSPRLRSTQETPNMTLSGLFGLHKKTPSLLPLGELTIETEETADGSYPAHHLPGLHEVGCIELDDAMRAKVRAMALALKNDRRSLDTTKQLTAMDWKSYKAYLQERLEQARNAVELSKEMAFDK
jgi:serine/threonine protein kinase